ncbi:hypothetical protein L1D11_21655 [Vibrio sp. Isolate32]|uniref:hypothetical protein n=1 Tax=Vibrio sp. Isolate32 TaxID=2908538 RepID=UPI001EFEAE98|nr:hypothetical protein [Vibrio sp. Isolate32]MCG9555825.1 hypothetical protein [Vibrio sp. Isolate32]
MWQLTGKGRAYAETQHLKALTPRGAIDARPPASKLQIQKSHLTLGGLIKICLLIK